jgi:Squalene-hopene cyclase C-terminal domain/Prenyltransferase and squalene oxidase repeat
MTLLHTPVTVARRRLPALLAACAALSVCAVCPALAAAANQTDQARLDSTVRYLQNVQNPDGGFGGASGAESSPDFSAWVALALAAAGINPQDQTQPAGTDAYTYLAEHAGELTRANAECPTSSCTTELDRVLLVVDASGTNPHDFGGVDVARAILERQLPEGSFPHYVGEKTAGINDTIFAVLALSPISEPAVREGVKRAATWLEDEQDPDGGWPATCPRTAVMTCAAAGPEPGEVDMTGAAIQALEAAGRTDAAAEQSAFEFLHEAQNPEGGFPEYPGRGEESNVASTAWATQGIWSAGENPETTWVTTSGGEPLAFMASLQQDDGHIRYEARKEENGVWMTAYVAPAFAGRALPIPPVPRGELPPSPSGSDSGSTPTSPGSAEPGQGGESARSGSGVIAGGGGNGATLFSRPQPQSKGKTPGGVRSLGSARDRRPIKPTRNPAPRRRAPAHTGAAPASNPSTSHIGSGSGRTLAGTSSGGGQAGGPDVKGVLISAPAGANKDALESGAPGLHSAGAGGNQAPWLAIGIGATAMLLALAGMQLERRRPQVIL